MDGMAGRPGIWGLRAALLVAVGGGCWVASAGSGREAAVARPEREAAATPSSAGGEARAGGAAPDEGGGAEGLTELIVGSERGLEAWSLDGARRRLVSAGAALHPRWLDEASVLAVVPLAARPLGAGATLERIRLADGRRERVAALPPFACGDGAAGDGGVSFEALDLHDGADFELAPSEGLACLRLLDRNLDMASVVLDVQVDVRRGGVERWLVVGDDVCRPPRDVQPGEPARRCERAGAPSASSSATARYTYDLPDADGRVVEATPQGERVALQLGLDYAPEVASPTGRWLVLGGDTVEGDYLYRRLSLLDRESGRVYPIGEAAGPWPSALEPVAGSPPTLVLPIERAALVEREADVRWLSTREGERLVVGSHVVWPGRGSFMVDGEIAR